MRVNVIGTRGFPLIQGGVEKHCECLYPLLAEKGCKIKVFRRTPYLNNQNASKSFRGVNFSDLWCPKSKHFEAIIHCFFASLISLFERPDIVHIHNIGPALFLPLLKLGCMRTIVTYHSANYEHEKWNKFARMLLMISEKLLFRLADKVIFVSNLQYGLANCLNKVYIPNGVFLEERSRSYDAIHQLGLQPGKYTLAVARFSPEKGLLDLIKAYKPLTCDYKLVIAGDADHETEYSRRIRDGAAEDNRIILTGFISGERLNQIYSHARLFILPSHNEGFPIALLEALSYGLPVLVSDIPANKEVGLPAERYFRCGDVKDLKNKMETLVKKGLSGDERKEMRVLITEKYNWEKIAGQTIQVYEKVLDSSLK